MLELEVDELGGDQRLAQQQHVGDIGVGGGAPSPSDLRQGEQVALALEPGLVGKKRGEEEHDHPHGVVGVAAGSEIGDDAVEHLADLGDALGAEQQPAEAHEVEENQPLQRAFPPAPGQLQLRFERAVGAQQQAVEQPPEDEGPAGAVPQAAEQHGRSAD